MWKNDEKGIAAERHNLNRNLDLADRYFPNTTFSHMLLIVEDHELA